MLLAPNAWAEDVLRLVTQSLPPYASVYHDGKLHGTTAGVLLCLLNKLGTDYDVDMVPWARAEHSLAFGASDAMFPAIVSAARDQAGVASVPVGSETWSWFWLAAANLSNKDLLPARGLDVGAVHGTDARNYLAAKGYRIVAEPDSLDSLLHMLFAGRAKAMLAPADAVQDLLARDGDADKVLSQPMATFPTVVYFSRAYLQRQPGFLATFNREVPACRAQQAEFQRTHTLDGYLKH